MLGPDHAQVGDDEESALPVVALCVLDRVDRVDLKLALVCLELLPRHVEPDLAVLPDLLHVVELPHAARALLPRLALQPGREAHHVGEVGGRAGFAAVFFLKHTLVAPLHLRFVLRCPHAHAQAMHSTL